MEAEINLDFIREEPSGVWRAGCCESRRWNRGDLIRSADLRCCDGGYKPQEAKSYWMPDEKSDEAILPLSDETTQLISREGPLLQPAVRGGK
jgi:hypothetical protein